MPQFATLFSTLFLPALLFSADFRSGQAARAVVGQSSFSVLTDGITPTALSLGSGRLFVTDKGQRVLSYDVANLLNASRDSTSGSCAVCLSSPVSVTTQSVISGVSRVSTFANAVAIADPAGHRVLLWKDSRSAKATSGPDVILGSSGDSGTPVSGSTIIDPISVALDGHRLFVGDAALHRVLVWNSLPANAAQPADAVLGQMDLSSSSDRVSPAMRITRPTALASDGRNLFVADSATHRVLVFGMSDFALSGKSVLNSATGNAGPLAPGSLFTIEGEGFTDKAENAVDDGERDLPTALAGVEVMLEGRALPLLSVSPTEIRSQIPYDLHGADYSSLIVRVESGSGHSTFSNAVPMEFRSASPGILAFAGSEPRSAMVLHVNSESGESSSPVTSAEPAKPGQTIVLWAAGLGSVVESDGSIQAIAGRPYLGDAGTPLSEVRAEIDGQPLQVLSAVLPRYSIGVYEVRVLLPPDLSAESSSRLTLSQGEAKSNTVKLPVGDPIQ